MNRITNENFQQYFPIVEDSLKKATFIAIDAEFSGLTRTTSENSANKSLFDSPSDRYSKLKDEIDPFIAIQFGLTTFTHTTHENKYDPQCFRFHLFPRAFPIGNRLFLYQASSVEFLVSHDFDFNQLAYNGISYLDEADEEKLRNSLRDTKAQCRMSEMIFYEDGDAVDDTFHRVQKWLSENNEENALKISTTNFPVQYFIQKELRKSFKGLWTETQGLRQFLVVKVPENERKILEEREDKKRSLDNELLDYYMGFSKVINLMKKLKKPIVGHNLLLDLMFIHKQFFRPLPKRYESFKSAINQHFPLIYDTKYLSYELKTVLHTKSWKSNGLAELYTYFKDGEGRYLALNSPKIGPPGGTIVSDDEKFHDAAWDSYCTGYCFIRMAHIYAVKRLSNNADMRSFTNAEIMAGVKSQANRINLIKADLSYLRLDGSDPPSTRPPWLHVQTFNDNISTRQIAQTFSHFGAVDVQKYSPKCFLVAAQNHGVARDILEHYEANSELKVVPYDAWKHSSKRVNVLIWAGSCIFLSSIGVVVFLLNRSTFSNQITLG